MFFFLCPPPPSNPHSLRQSPHHYSCHVYKSFDYSISYNVLYIPMAVTTYLYFLIPSSLHPFPLTPLTSGNHQNILCIHDSVSVLLVCSVCFLGSIVDRYVFSAILLFIVLIFFFFKLVPLTFYIVMVW